MMTTEGSQAMGYTPTDQGGAFRSRVEPERGMDYMEELITQEMLVDVLRIATGEVLSTMLALEASPAESYIEDHPGKSAGVVSFVGLAGSDCVGTGSLQCESVVACQLASRFLLSEFESIDENVLDALGELTNMIIGNFKNEVEKLVGPLALSIPTVVYGLNFSTRSTGHEGWTVVPFVWDSSQLNVKVCLKATKTGPSHLLLGEKQEFILGD
jgi:chemotaxis protein CheX